MKLLTGSVLALALAFGAALPSFAGTMVPEGEISGEIQSIDGSVMTVKTQSGSTQEYSIDPGLVSSLNLEQGKSVLINGTQLMRGVITGVDDHTVKVEHDNGKVSTYILHREGRRYLSYGDRVVINAMGQVVREDRYMLTATEITPIHDYIVASHSSTTIASTVSTPEPVVQPTYTPVQGMW